MVGDSLTIIQVPEDVRNFFVKRETNQIKFPNNYLTNFN